MITDRQAVVRVEDPRWLAPKARLRLTNLSLAVLLAMPVATVSVSLAQDAVQPNTEVVLVAMQDANADPKAALAAAVDLFKAGKYEESLTALQSIKAETLSDADKATLADTIAQAEDASNRRRGARADFDKGEAALGAGNFVEAANLYKSVASNQYADEGTKAKAAEQLAVAEAGMKGTQTDNKTTYETAVADYKAGRLDDAKAKFAKLQENNFRAPWFNKSPREYLELIEKQQAGPTPAEQARSAYLSGRDQYNKGDWIGARVNFNKAVELSYKPGWFERSPSDYLKIMDKRELADARKAAEQNVALAQNNEPKTTDVPVAPAPDNTTAQPAPTNNNVAPTNDPVAVAPPVAEDAAKLQAIENEKRLKREQNEAAARAIVSDARNAENAASIAIAAELYAKALELDPNNAEAAAGRQRTLQTAGISPVQRDMATEREARILAERQYINSSFERFMTEAELNVARQRFDAARNSLQQAQVVSRTNPGIFTNPELEQFDQRLASARVSLDAAVQAYAENQRVVAEQQARADAAAREAERIRVQQQAVASLIADARRLTDQGNYEQALKTVNQILTIDPRNDYATGVRQILFDRWSLQNQRRHKEIFTEQLIQTYDAIEEKKIPYADVLTYPVDWPDLSARRDQTVREERAITAADEQVQGLLEKSLPEIRFQDVAMADVVDFLRDTTQANIFVNWKALEAIGVDRNTPVSTRLRNVKFSKVLRTILDSVGGGATTSQLGYTVDEGVITISTTEDLARNVETRTYDIRDLIIAIPDFSDAPDFSLTGNGGANNNNNNGGGFGGGGGGGGGLFGGNNNNNDDDEDEDTPSREELVEQITSLIRETIGVGTWKEDGGQLGSLRELGGQLIVTQTPEVHRAIGSLLEKLREQRSIQVMVEARFLSVQRNFLEDIGVDFDFYINNDNNPYAGASLPGVNADGTTNNFFPAIGADGRNTYGFSPMTVQNNSANFTQVGNLQTGVGGNLAGQFSTPNLSTTINAFLDDFQASLIIRATQGNQNVTQLTAPRVTLFNGQRAYVLVATQIAYVSDLSPVVGQGAFGFDPQVDVIQSGVVLDVAATVSADRKYVTLTLRPQLSRVVRIQSFPVFGGTTGDDDDDDTGDDDTTFESGVGFIQQPEIEITEVRTSVSVPDGGTLLLGGTTVSGEIEREAGVPVVSKIPFLKRAFTNRGYAKDENVLLIMVKPTIIIQREIEQYTFPLLTSRPG